MGADTTASLRVSDKLTLTEAGWCARCEDDWSNDDNGCADKREEKEEHCAYYTSTPTSAPNDDTSTPTSAPNEDDASDSKNSGAKLTLTEAGWCARCEDDWSNDDNGCADNREE